MNPTIETPSHCPLCGDLLRENPEECSRCDWVRGYRHHQQETLFKYDPRDAAAALLSIVPGAGHIFKGHNVAGVLLMAGVPVVCVFAFAFTMFFGWLLVPTYWIGVGADAYLRKDVRGAGLHSPMARR
jgi:hypothetical protein